MQLFCAAALLLNVCASEMGRRLAFDVFVSAGNKLCENIIGPHFCMEPMVLFTRGASACDLICSVIIAVPVRLSAEYLSMFPHLHQH